MTKELKRFEQWWDAEDDIPNDGPYTPDTPIQFAWAGWQAALAQPEQQPVSNTDKLAQPEQEPNKDGSPCPEFWDWLPKAYNFDGNGAFTKYNMEVAFLAGKQTSQPAQQEPVATDGKWYWVRYEGLGKTYEAPALYRESAKAFYSVEFSGIPAQQVKVLCEYPPAQQEPVAFDKTVCPFCTSEWVTAEQHDRNVDRVEQEPFAFLHPQKGFYFAKLTKILAPTIVDVEPLALYTTPQQRKPLTKSQVLDLWEQTYVQRGATGIEFARAIEAAHGIKE